ncbi:MAG: Gfo/Idh/MocA family oxidoreductase [Planctomycetes bacterium]|nr:Gfo/Idh/MocA family oxidoreductase [Planctomycetota bacterium]
MSDLPISRRTFLTATASSLAFTYIPRRVWGANERFYVAGIGVGGKGAGEVTDVTKAGGVFVALCDVDETRAAKTFAGFPEAKRYQDFRVMLEKEKGIEAVTVSTPDHTHALASLTAMALGKHVYCQKPLTHSIYEARVMEQAARYFKVQTQMGNQAHSGEPIRRAVELVRAGIIGPVREVHAWTNRPIWPQGQAAWKDRDRLAQEAKPQGLDWDLWVGPAPIRDYNACYVPFKWRGWWDFGTGALGDMACHIMDMAYWALDLGAPLSVEAESGGQTRETGPDWSTITYQFAARRSVGGGEVGGSFGPKAAVEMPAVKYVWYDGRKDGKENAPHELLARVTREAGKAGTKGIRLRPARADKAPERKKKAEEKKKAMAVEDPRAWDVILVGDAGLMLFRRASADWIVAPGGRGEQFAETPKTIRRVPSEDAEWIAACRGGPKPLSSFDYSSRLTEMVLLGNLAVRLNQKIEWNSAALKAPNAPEADALIRRSYRKGWDLPVPADVLRIG